MDTGSGPPAGRWAAGRLVAPLLLLAAIGGWYWLAQTARPPTAAATPALTATTGAPATAAQATPAPTSAPQGLVGLATPWGAAGLEPTPTATAAAVVAGGIVLYGPPAGSSFGAGDEVSFYWGWPEALADGQRFVLYLLLAGERRPLGQVDEANLGRVYHLRVPVEQTGDFRWEIVLEDAANGATIGASENRALRVIGG